MVAKTQHRGQLSLRFAHQKTVDGDTVLNSCLLFCCTYVSIYFVLNYTQSTVNIAFERGGDYKLNKCGETYIK